MKIPHALLMIAMLAGGIVVGSSSPKVADSVVRPAQAAQCAYIVATRVSCSNEGCSYASLCRPTVCPPVGYQASKIWQDIDPFAPTIHHVSYRAILRTTTAYPTCSSPFNTLSNWKAP